MLRILISTVICSALLVDLAWADQPASVDFRNDLIPVLTKSGCNAGACHGAALGRGGFKLSLYGGSPAEDFDAITRQLSGRRINVDQPDQSLIVLKPTQGIEHEGGMVFSEDAAAAKLLVRWIRQGAKSTSKRKLLRVDVTPQTHVVNGGDTPVKLHSMAHYSDGTSRDVTQWTIFTAEDTSAVDVDAERAIVRRRGRHIVVARYLDQVIPVQLIWPMSDKPVDLANEPRSNFIDNQILKSLAMLRLPVSPVIDDDAFARRVTLDLTGRLSPGQHAKGSRPRKDSRVAIVDQLLQSDAFVEYWTLKLARWLRMKSPDRTRESVESGAALTAYHSWLSEQIKQGTGYDRLARSLILASGDSHSYGPANFYRTVAGPREQAEFVSELFMGSRLRCANCHNHPLDRWTQDDYHGLAAIFAKLEVGKVIKPRPNGEVIHPRTLEAAVAKIPGESMSSKAIARSGLEDGKERAAFADWLTRADNPYFAKAIVNRLWKSMMGRGLVEPVDDFRATNPATHPELLNRLAADFQSNGYDIRRTLRMIACSTTYARSADALEQNKDDEQFYSHSMRRRLEPEVMADAITDVLGIGETYGAGPTVSRAVALIDPQVPSRSLDILGRCGREESCESQTATVGGLPKKLHLLNGELLNGRIGASGSRLDKLLTAGRTPKSIVTDFYRVALGREPTGAEATHWDRLLSKAETAKQRRDCLEDFVWALMTCQEFGTNH